MPKKAKARKQPRSITAQDVAIGTLIHERRRALGMSQSALGKHLGVSFQQTQKYEKGINRVSVRRLAVISAVLGVPVAHFYGHDESAVIVPGFGELDPLARRAVNAFAKISSPAVRREIVRLAEQLAG